MVCEPCDETSGGDGLKAAFFLAAVLVGLAIGGLLVFMECKKIGWVLFNAMAIVTSGLYTFVVGKITMKFKGKALGKMSSTLEAWKEKMDEAAEASEAPPQSEEEAAARAEAKAEKEAKEAKEAKQASGRAAVTKTVRGALFDLLGYIQINASFSASLPDVGWPSSFANLSDSVSRLFNVNFATQLGTMDCVLHTNICHRTLGVMLLVIGVLLGRPISLWLMRSCRLVRDAERQANVANGAMTFFLVLGALAHMPISNLLLGCLQCEYFGDIGRLSKDRSLECGSEPVCLGTALVFLPLFTLGLPLFMLSRLASFSTSFGKARLRRRLERSGGDYEAALKVYQSQFAFFVDKYEEDYWWYEVLEMARKLLLTSVASFLDATRTPYSELTAKIAISFFFLLMFVRHSPKSDDLLDVVMFTAQLCTFLTLMYALLLKIDFFEAEGVTPNVTATVLMLIQLAPLFVALVVFVSAYTQRYGKAAVVQAKMARAGARRMSRQLTTHLSAKDLRAVMVKADARDPAIAANNQPGAETVVG